MLLSKANRLPDGARWAFEVKWDGFRAPVLRTSCQTTLHEPTGRRLDVLLP